MEASFLEEVAASLVREFLSKKCLKKTIVVMDEELPRTALSINNRNELRNVLHLQFLCKQNKARENPLKTLLEIMASYFLERTSGSKGLKGSPPAPQKKLPQPRCTEDSVLKNYLSDEDAHLQTGPGKSKTETFSYEIDGEVIPKRDLHKKSEKCKAGTAFESSSPSEGEKPASHHYGDLRTPELSMNATREQPQARSGGLFGRGMMAGPPVNSPEESLKRRRTKQPSGIRRTFKPGEEKETGDRFAAPMGDSQEGAGISRPSANLFSPHLGRSIDVTKDYSSMILTGSYTNAGGEGARNSAQSIEGPFAKLMSERRPVEERKAAPLYPAEMNKASSRLNFLTRQTGADRERTARSTPKSEPQNTEFRKMPVSSPSRDSLNQDALELVDVEDEENLEDVYMIPNSSALYAVQVTSKPIDYYLARDLKILLFGSSLGCFSEEWKIQSFIFNDNPQLKYGIVQKKGGPCGVLAVVQACLLRHLIFGDSSRNSDTCRQCLQVSAATRTQCLALAIAGILWRGGGRRKATIALCTGTQQFTPVGKYKADGILETLMLHVATSYEDLLRFLQQNIHQFEAGPYGCILLTLSAILSRSIDQVRGDFDVITNRLIGAHGYCTQELVNLLLTGQAVSNVFNDVMELDSGNGNITLLKGVSARSDIGVLSLFEHYNICQVGCYLKTPKFPIWVVCSESHFSVLFCLRKDLLADWKTERRFDLYYYDGLANQQDEIRLTVDTSQPYIEGKDNDLIPPLEHCIRTKWKGAVIDWNGTEPIL
uniref:probable ubiquitin carboxyl-terminal hydrolase MINDY-4 isoform X1 n=2 Tax=Podarcis muralis TaxID=64176 RepID=UPI00109F66EA|nr:probable ubiquitin carboxyl-terminal hydrolase MINDY-4 isoform X1 [Podarcis muralis]